MAYRRSQGYVVLQVGANGGISSPRLDQVPQKNQKNESQNDRRELPLKTASSEVGAVPSLAFFFCQIFQPRQKGGTFPTATCGSNHYHGNLRYPPQGHPHKK